MYWCLSALKGSLIRFRCLRLTRWFVKTWPHAVQARSGFSWVEDKQSMTRKQHVLWQCRATRKLTLQRAANEKHLNSTNIIFEPAGDRELRFPSKETSQNCVWTTSQQKYCLLYKTVGHLRVLWRYSSLLGRLLHKEVKGQGSGTLLLPSRAQRKLSGERRLGEMEVIRLEV